MISSNKHFHVFSYGSNMLFDRIQKRVSSVEVIHTHQLEGFELGFNKLSDRDGSTKANLIPSNNGASVHGVIHRIDFGQKQDLDRYEGLGFGYDLGSFKTSIEGTARDVHYYIAHEAKYLHNGPPYDWYWEYVYYGALENDLPAHHIDSIKATTPIADVHKTRREEHDEVLKRYRRMYNEA